MCHIKIRILVIAILLIVSTNASCLAQNRDVTTLSNEWENAKTEFLTDIDRSLNSILRELDNRENELRNLGELAKLKALQDIRAKFIEKGELHATVPRTAYDKIRKAAVEIFTTRRKDLVVRALQQREDSLAELVEKEFAELSDPLIADVQARWVASIDTYEKECEDARSLIIIQLDKLEEKGRAAADPTLVESAKKGKADFLASGTAPPGVATASYDGQLQAASERLQQVNKSLVRTLLLNKHDDQAKTMSDSLALATNHVAKALGVPGVTTEEKRKAWQNQSYNSVLYHRKGDKWEEMMNGTGKLERHLRELSRNGEYIELLLLDRQQLMRVYNERADLFKDGRWQWVSNGVWLIEK